MRAEVSSAMAFLNSTPRLAPRPVPTMIAVGVARPSASGQVITTTVIANSTAALAGRSVASSHTAKFGQPLPGRLGVLRLLDELDDLRQRGVGADPGRPHPQGPVLVDGRADHRRAGLLVGREALARDRSEEHTSEL